MYVELSDCLKVASCCFDLIYLQSENNTTPKYCECSLID